MNKIAEPITFVSRLNDDFSDDSCLSEGDVAEIKKTGKFIEKFLMISNSQKVIIQKFFHYNLLFLGQ